MVLKVICSLSRLFWLLSHSFVVQIGELLEQSDSVNYFKFIINPHSFEQSVENLFYFSFLIRDGKAAWDIKEDKEPIICKHVQFSRAISYLLDVYNLKFDATPRLRKITTRICKGDNLC